MDQTKLQRLNISRFASFLTFSRISLSSFGGAIFWARRELVERRRWLSEREFVEMYTLGQLLPGPNVLNLTVMVGYRFAGWTGAAAAVRRLLGLAVSRGHRNGRTVPALWRSAAGAAGTHRYVERGGRTAACHRDQVGHGIAAALAAVVVRRTGLCRRGRHPLAAVVGHGRSRAMGCLRGLERAGVMDRLDLGALFLHFLMLWFIAIGGPSTILPDIHRYVVDVHHLLTNTQFAEIYTLAQVAPGPNVMYVTLIGWQLAGWAGAAATTIPLLVPATTLTLFVGHLNERYPNARIGHAIRRGLTPITLGLVFASATILMRAVNHDWRGYLITLLTVAVVLRKSWNPLWLFAGGALVGILGFV